MEKVSTTVFAKNHGLNSKSLFDKLSKFGYLGREDGKYVLSPIGQGAGGEYRERDDSKWIVWDALSLKEALEADGLECNVCEPIRIIAPFSPGARVAAVKPKDDATRDALLKENIQLQERMEEIFKYFKVDQQSPGFVSWVRDVGYIDEAFQGRA